MCCKTPGESGTMSFTDGMSRRTDHAEIFTIAYQRCV